MDRRRFMKTAAGLFIPLAPALTLPKDAAAQGGMGPGPGTAHSTGGSEATVLIDINPGVTLTRTGGGVTSLSVNAGNTLNVGGGPNGTSNRCVMALLLFGGANGGTSTSVSANWDAAGTPQAMTQVPGGFIQNGANGGDIYAFYRMAPTQGNLAFSASWTGANQCTLFMISFVNVDQTGGTTSFPVVVTSTSAQGSTQSIAVSTSPTTRKILGAFNGLNNYVSTTDQDMGHDNGSNVFALAASYDNATAGSLNYTASGTPSPAILGIALKGA